MKTATKSIPTQDENPEGLHQRYVIKKLVRKPQKRIDHQRFQVALLRGDPNKVNEYTLADVDPAAQYFVLRLDEGGKNREHIKAGRIGVHAYADAIQHHLPQLAKDLKEKYPLL